MELCGLVPGLRAIDGGPLANARIVEALTALMIGINIRYKLPAGTGIRFTGLPARLSVNPAISSTCKAGSRPVPGPARRSARAPSVAESADGSRICM